MFKDKLFQKITIHQAMLLIAYTVILILAAIHYASILAFIQKLFQLIKPFLYGFAMAFVFYLPMKKIEQKLPTSIRKGRKILSAMGALLIVFIIVIFLFNIVVPQLIDSIMSFMQSLPTYLSQSEAVIRDLLDRFQLNDDIVSRINAYNDQIQEMLLDLASDIFPFLVNVGKGLTTSITNIFMALVIAVYLLFSKEVLMGQVQRFSYAFLPTSLYHYLRHACKITNSIFASFISGQLVEVIIIGVLCYIGCIVLRIPYAPIVSVIVGCTNIIPIFGPIIGTIVCGILILFVAPVKAIVFVIFGICLQQFESNLIYPRVVGSSVGLNGLWTLFAITIGGGLFGLVGMVLGLPTFAVLYTLLKEETQRRFHKKQQLLDQDSVEDAT